MRLGGPDQGDGEAERLDLAHMVAELAVGVGAGLVVVAEVAVPGLGVGEQVPGDDQDGAGDGPGQVGADAGEPRSAPGRPGLSRRRGRWPVRVDAPGCGYRRG